MKYLMALLCLIRAINAFNYRNYTQFDGVFAPKESIINKCVVRVLKNINFPDKRYSVVTFVNGNDESITSEVIRYYGSKRPMITRKYHWSNANMVNHVYVIDLRYVKDMAERLKNLTHDYYWNPNAKFIILVEGDVIKDIRNVFTVFLMHNVYNVLVIGRLEGSEVNGIYTYFPFENNSCGNPTSDDVRLLSDCIDIDVKLLFSEKIVNSMKRCTLKFITHHYSPFINSKGIDNGGEGIDQFLLKVLSQVEGFNYELIDYGTVEKFGKILNNYSYTGMLQYIESGVVDGAVGGYILQWNRAIALDFLYPYLTDHVVVVIPRARLMDKWQAIGMQFKYPNMVLILLSYIVFSMASFGFSVFSKNRKSILRDFIIVFGYLCNNISVLYLNRTYKSRIVFWNMIIFVMVIGCAVQTSLLSSCTRPMRAYQIDSYEKVLDGNYELVLSPAMAHYVQSFYDIKNLNELNKILNNPPCKTTLECLMDVKRNDRFYTLSSELYHQNSVWKLADVHGNVMVHQIKSPLSYCWQTIYFRKGFPFLDKFNSHINNIVASGILRKHIDDLEYRERLKHYFRSESAHVPIDIQDIRYIFVALVSGWGLSCFVLVCELIIHRRYSGVK